MAANLDPKSPTARRGLARAAGPLASGAEDRSGRSVFIGAPEKPRTAVRGYTRANGTPVRACRRPKR